jgi:hypothetical protein
MFVCCGRCVLSGRGICDGLITRPEESYRLWRVVVCDQQTSKTRLKPATGLWKKQPQWVVTPGKTDFEVIQKRVHWSCVCTVSPSVLQKNAGDCSRESLRVAGVLVNAARFL